MCVGRVIILILMETPISRQAFKSFYCINLLGGSVLKHICHSACVGSEENLQELVHSFHQAGIGV